MELLVTKSERFRPYLPDDCQVNPNVFGFELASWLSRILAERGIITSYPNYEDWGWFLEKLQDEAEYMICCSGSVTETGTHEWKMFVTQPKRVFRRPSPKNENRLLDQIADVVREEKLSIRIE